MLTESISKSTEFATVVLATGTTVFIMAQAFRQGVFKKIQFGSIAIEAKDSLPLISNTLPLVKLGSFENEQLANYYAQVLNQSRTSFWFSLIFASIGFVVILITAFMKSGTETVPGFVAGLIVDAVSAMFFVQSKNAQKSMAEFFDKLRLDKQQVEAKAFCTEITNQSVRDALKVQLSLFYAGIAQHNEIAERIISEHLKQP